MMADRNRARSSVPKPPTRRALSPTVDAGSFVAMAEVGDAVPWGVSDFCVGVTSPESPLHAFISGDVRNIACYRSNNHHYLLMRVHLQNEGVPIVWLQIETFLYTPGKVRFSNDPSKLRPGNDDIMVTAFAALNFRHVVDLLSDVSTKSVFDSRWASGVIVGMLHGGFNGSWVKPPPPEWLKTTLSSFEILGATTESMERRFAIRHPNVKKISPRDPDLWKSGPASLSQSPISKQVHPEGTDSNIAGTKEETAHVASAPSEDHLQGPRPVQSPNANGTVPAATDAEKNERVGIMAPSAEALRQGPQASPPFSNLQSNLPETPNLTGRIVRLGSFPMATGGYSSVWRGTLFSPTSDNPDQALQVAIKVLRASYTDEDTLKRKLHKRLHVEMRIWAQLHHENVVRLLGHTEEPEGPGLVSISYPHGNVLSFLAKNPSVNREIICADVALGLQYLHQHKPPVIHGDLKGPNVLIDGEGRASICDFGLSIILDGDPTGYTSSNFGGTLRFLAPELLEESSRTVETDVYAYACTCIAILFDQEPYHKLSKEAHLMRAIFTRQPPFELSNEEATFPSFWRILKRCWDHDRMSRPSLNLIIDAIQRCLYRTYRTNVGIHRGIGRYARFMCLPGIEEAKLISVADGGLSIVVHSSGSLHRVPIYQRYRWELMNNQNLDDSEFGSDASSPLSGKDASSESPSYVSKWTDYSAKFRLPCSSMVSYESYRKASS